MSFTAKAYWRSLPRALAVFRSDGPHGSVLSPLDRYDLADALAGQKYIIDTVIMVQVADPVVIMEARKAIGLTTVDAWVAGPGGSRAWPMGLRPAKIEGAPQIKVSVEIGDYPAHPDYAPLICPFQSWPRQYSTDPNDWYGVGLNYDPLGTDHYPVDSLFYDRETIRLFEKQLDAAIGGRYPVWRRIV